MLNLKILKINFLSDSDLFYQKTKDLFNQVASHVEHKAQFNWFADQIKDEMMKSSFTLAVRRDSDQVIGFVACREGFDQNEVMALGVHTDYLRKGVMKALLMEILDKSRGGCEVSKPVLLEVHEHNTAAIAVYRECGLVQVGIRRLYYTDGASALLFRSQE